ncbi:hypothetical protein [Sphingomonas sp. dw_22]|uniref:hypothetical protein n=1 Tax=Sphingomonas sp. dw_22 TaxID=2721175 RepID=UPI00211620AA|nr:hypothetical protein [Sphingomonas sp. dw_22]
MRPEKQLERNGGADAASAACHERDLSSENFCHFRLPVMDAVVCRSTWLDADAPIMLRHRRRATEMGVPIVVD